MYPKSAGALVAYTLRSSQWVATYSPACAFEQYWISTLMATGAWSPRSARRWDRMMSFRPTSLQTKTYDAYTEYRRPRSMNLRTWLTQHINRQFLAAKKKLVVNNVGKSHCLFRNGRLTDNQRRWALAPSEGDLGMCDSIRTAVFNMPEVVANQGVHYLDPHGRV